MRKIIFLSFGVLFILFVFVSNGFACFCGRIRRSQTDSAEEPRDNIKPKGNVVFSGKAVSLRKYFIFKRIRFRVDRVWEGDVSETMLLLTGDGNGDCGYPFKKGENYLVYGSESEDRKLILTNICSETAKIIDAAERLKILGKGQAPKRKSPRQNLRL